MLDGHSQQSPAGGLDFTVLQFSNSLSTVTFVYILIISEYFKFNHSANPLNLIEVKSVFKK